MTAMPILTCLCDIDAPTREVWRVLTTPDLIQEWARAYCEGLSIRTSWREGEQVIWKTRGGYVHASGRIAACQPDRLLKFDYDSDGLTGRNGFSEAFEIEAMDRKSRLRLTTGPLGAAAWDVMQGQAEEAVQEIKSLAEELARIHGLR